MSRFEAAQRALRNNSVELILRDLNCYSPLCQNEVERIASAARRPEVYEAGAQLRAADDRPRAGMVLSGWVSEQRILVDGRRQIFTFLVAGDPVLVSGANSATRTIVALTRTEFVDLGAVIGSGADHPQKGAAAAFKAALAVQQERLFDQIVRLGRQTAYERVAHLLLELRDRLQPRGLVTGDSFRIPLTQETLADALGLSIVHINRTLQQLRREGLIELKSGGVTLLKPGKLSTIAGAPSNDLVERPRSFAPLQASYG